MKVVNELKPNKSEGPDQFHPKLRKETVNNIKGPLCIIFNKSARRSITRGQDVGSDCISSWSLLFTLEKGKCYANF